MVIRVKDTQGRDLWMELADRTVRAFNAGGGFVQNVRVEDILEIARHAPSRMRTGRVTFDDGPVIWARWNDNDRWNGWLRPMTNADGVRAIAAWQAANDQTNPDECSCEVFTVAPSGSFWISPPEGEEPYELQPDADGLYDLNMGWTWYEYTPPRCVDCGAACNEPDEQNADGTIGLCRGCMS